MSLREIKTRISSVKSTRKITSAMRLVSTFKLRKSQDMAESISPYVKELESILEQLLTTDSFLKHPLIEPRTVKRRAVVVVYSANNSLCGGFNANILKHFSKLIETLRQEYEHEPLIFPIGEKVTQFSKKTGLEIDTTYVNLAEKRNLLETSELSDRLMKIYLQGACDKVILTYTHFKSIANQIIVDRTFLPIIEFDVENDNSIYSKDIEKFGTDYILEPSAEEILNTLLPMSLRTKIYSASLESYVSEQAARVMAMQLATDNADKLLDELVLRYNKSRQQAITNELLDIIGGTIR